MKKMDGKSLDLTEQNIEKLKALFPQVVTENQIDFEKLRLILGDEVDTGPEKYQFTWPGKADSIRLAQEPSTKTLRPVMEDSKDWDTTKNLYIEGDNLEVLKQLQKTYHGKVDMIYIDPPYNTGNDFVYNDKFAQSSEDYKIETNQGLISNPETSGRYHSNWLNMMYSRLILAKNILRNDGVIFVSIDDNELENLLKIGKEIFGENNIEIMVWKKKGGASNTEKILGILTEYIVLFFKNKKPGVTNYRKISREYSYSDAQGKYNLEGIEKTNFGTYYRPTMYYSITDPKTGTEFWPAEGQRWTFSKEGMDSLLINNKLLFDYEKNKVYRKKYASDYRESKICYSNLLLEHGNLTTAKSEIEELLEKKELFDTPKPLALIEQLIKIGSKGNIIMDFFSGSSTTAHAVMKLNAEDGGNRQFIMVQLPEETDEKSEAYKAGYENICEIGKERIRRAGEQIKEELKEKQSKGEDVRDPDTLDVGFKVFRLDETNIVPWEGKKVEDEEAQIDLLAMLEEVFKEDRSSLDIAYEIMLKYGVFDQALEKVSINGKEMFDVGHGYMLICLEEDIGAEDINVIGEKGYTHVVFNDRSFKDDNVKLNAEHSLKNLGVEEVVSI